LNDPVVATPDEERSNHPLLPEHPSRCGAYLVIVATVLAGLLLMQSTDDNKVPDAALAALAAAVIGVVGTHLGHVIGHHHGTQQPAQRCKHARGQDLIVLAALALVLIILGVGVAALRRQALPRLLGVTDEAAAALLAALIAPGADLAHEGWFRPYKNRWVAPGIILGSVVAGMVVLWVQGSWWSGWQLDPEGFAAFAAVGVSTGGTFLGHHKGYQLAAESREPGRQPSI
jgi:hypothetical protein